MGMRKMVRLAMLVTLGLAAAMPAAAQVRTIDPNSANADLAPVPSSESAYGTTMPAAPAQAAPASGATTAAPVATLRRAGPGWHRPGPAP